MTVEEIDKLIQKCLKEKKDPTVFIPNYLIQINKFLSDHQFLTDKKFLAESDKADWVVPIKVAQKAMELTAIVVRRVIEVKNTE